MTLTWSSTTLWGFGIGNIVRVTSPNARWIAFTYDGSNRITEAKDNIGRTVGYQYPMDSGTALEGHRRARRRHGIHLRHRAPDADHQGPTRITCISYDYDADGWVEKQTQGDGGEYEFAYTVNGERPGHADRCDQPAGSCGAWRFQQRPGS